MPRFIRTIASISGFAFSLFFSAGAFAASPLVDSGWLKDNLGNENLVILDVRSGISGASKATFEAGHIPGSVHTDYLKDGWRIENAQGIPGFLPSVAQLEALIGGLGISEESHVVVVPAGKAALDMGSATRVYWTLKVAGHDNVSILNGGFAGWTKDKKNPIATGQVTVSPAIFTATLQPQLIASKDDVKAAIGSGTSLIDNRPNDQFVGVNKHPASRNFGTIPGAKNVPENWLTENGGGTFRSSGALKKLYSVAAVGENQEEINFCNTGHWASLGWFVSHELLGNKKARLYDGSMVEWTADKNAPLDRKVAIN